MTLPLSAGAPRGQGDFLLLRTKNRGETFFFVSPRFFFYIFLLPVCAADA